MAKKNTNRAFIVPYQYCPPTNGGQHVAYAFSEFINQKEKLYCLSTDNNQTIDLPFELIPFFKDNKSKYFNPINAWKLFRFLKQNNISECILFQPFAFLLILPTLLFTKTKISIYVQNLEYKRFRSIGKIWWPIMFLWEMVCYKLSSKLYFVADAEITPACRVFKLSPSKCISAIAGTKYKSTPESNTEAIATIHQQFNPNKDTKLLLFYGSRYYIPNKIAVQNIIDQLIPSLRKQTDTPFLILIAGLGEAYLPLTKNVKYLGFVKSINDYIQGADLILNPVTQGAGIQTKVLEALALGATVIASKHATNGIDHQLCPQKLIPVSDTNFTEWSQKIIEHWDINTKTPPEFYNHYYWEHTLKDVE